MLNVKSAARALGGEVRGVQVLAPGPGHSSADRSLSVRLAPNAPDGFVVHSFAGDDPMVCREYVRVALGLQGPVPRSGRLPRPRPVVGIANDADGRTDVALGIWRQSVGIRGTPAEAYLHRRGLTLDLDPFEDLRFHSGLRLGSETVGGMVALMRDVVSNEPCGIHRTFLDQQARKLDRKMLGRARGACVKLSPDAEVTMGLGIAEGIETALSVLEMGWSPIWACLSAGALGGFPVLPGIDALTVFADNDESGTGEQAARQCSARWIEAGREALAIMPDTPGQDFADGVAA